MAVSLAGEAPGEGAEGRAGPGARPAQPGLRRARARGRAGPQGDKRLCRLQGLSLHRVIQSGFTPGAVKRALMRFADSKQLQC